MLPIDWWQVRPEGPRTRLKPMTPGMGELANYGGFHCTDADPSFVRLAARICLFSLPSFGFVKTCHISCWISWNGNASLVPTVRYHAFTIR